MSERPGPVGSDVAEPPPAPAPGALGRLRERVDAELGVSAFLLGLGALVLIETTRIPADVAQRGPVGPKAFPLMIGLALVVIAALHAVDVLRGGRGEAEAGEDIEVGAPADWKTVGLVIAAFVVNILLIEPLGWPISGALMFLIASRALGSRTLVRDVVVALALSFGTYFLFNTVLGLSLPAGVLEGVLP